MNLTKKIALFGTTALLLMACGTDDVGTEGVEETTEPDTEEVSEVEEVSEEGETEVEEIDSTYLREKGEEIFGYAFTGAMIIGEENPDILLDLVIKEVYENEEYTELQEEHYGLKEIGLGDVNGGILEYLQALEGEQYNELTVIIRNEFENDLGIVETEDVVDMMITKETVDTLNLEELGSEDIPNVADFWWDVTIEE